MHCLAWRQIVEYNDVRSLRGFLVNHCGVDQETYGGIQGVKILSELLGELHAGECTLEGRSLEQLEQSSSALDRIGRQFHRGARQM